MSRNSYTKGEKRKADFDAQLKRDAWERAQRQAEFDYQVKQDAKREQQREEAKRQQQNATYNKMLHQINNPTEEEPKNNSVTPSFSSGKSLGNHKFTFSYGLLFLVLILFIWIGIAPVEDKSGNRTTRLSLFLEAALGNVVIAS